MMNQFYKELPTVYTSDDGQHFIMLPSGEDLKPLVKTIVVDDCNDIPLARATFKVNIAKDRDEALAKYNEKQ